METKRLKCGEFSSRYSVRLLVPDDGETILKLCRTNPLYYACCGTEVTVEEILRDMTLLPPGVSKENKYYCGYFHENRLLAVLDLIDRYPDAQTAYIGFFMVDGTASGQGRGSAIMAELADFLRCHDIGRLRLAYDEKNPQAVRFWKKQGFVPLRLVEHEYGLLTLAEKTISGLDSANR